MQIAPLSPQVLLVPLLTFFLGGCAKLPFDLPSHPLYDAQPARDHHRATLRDQATRESGRVAVDQRLLGDRYFRQGDLQRALLAYFRAARLDPDDLQPRLRLARLEIGANPLRAERSFEALVSEEPDEPEAWFGLGLARLARSDLEGARLALVRAVKLDPNSVPFRSALGAVHDRLGQHLEARESLERALELAPDEVSVLNNLAVSYLLTRELRKAEELLRRAAEVDPQDGATQNNLGLSVGLQGRYDEALRIFRRGGNEQSAQNNLAYLHYLNGHAEAAVEIYERALLAGSDDEMTILRNLGRAQDALARGPGALVQ